MKILLGAVVIFFLMSIAVLAGYHAGYTNSTNNIDDFYECAGYMPWKVKKDGGRQVCLMDDGRQFEEPQEPK